MALHRDIHWIGRQWAVTGYGMQSIDRRHGGQFDIEIERLWDEDLLEGLSGERWFNPEDFSRGLAIARKRFPGTPRAAAPEPQLEPEPQGAAEPEPAPQLTAAPEPEPKFKPEPAPPEPVPAPPPPPVAPPMPDSIVAAPPPPQVAEVLKPNEPAPAEPPRQAQAAAPEDLLDKWFEAYGLNKGASPEPKPPRAVVPPAPVAKPHLSEPIATVEPTPAKELPIAKSIEPSPPASSGLQMPIPGRAKFVRPWRIPIQSIHSYKLWQRSDPS